jgi:hypothetical protein
MDIFTILVFFLLVSSSSVQDLPSAKQIKLPESVSPTIMTTVSFGNLSDTDSGSLICFALGKSWTDEELTNRKNTKIVKISIKDTIFSEALRFVRA